MSSEICQTYTLHTTLSVWFSVVHTIPHQFTSFKILQSLGDNYRRWHVTFIATWQTMKATLINMAHQFQCQTTLYIWCSSLMDPCPTHGIHRIVDWHYGRHFVCHTVKASIRPKTCIQYIYIYTHAMNKFYRGRYISYSRYLLWTPQTSTAIRSYQHCLMQLVIANHKKSSAQNSKSKLRYKIYMNSRWYAIII